MAKVGYIRVSTKEQNIARQEVMMKELGVDKLYIDKCSGKNSNRPELQKMLEYVRENDTVICESYSRLSRSVSDLIKITDQLNEMGITFISKKENVDTTTASGKLMMNVFASIYQFEREVNLERQKEGIAIARGKGKYKGRKAISYDEVLFVELYPQWKSKKITARKMMDLLSLKPNTFYRAIERYEA